MCEAYPKPMVTWITPTGVPVLTVPGSNPIHHALNGTNTAPSTPRNKYVVEEVYQGYRTTMRLKINYLTTEDFGSFKCVAKNTLGEKEGLIRLYGLFFDLFTLSFFIVTLTLQNGSTEYPVLTDDILFLLLFACLQNTRQNRKLSVNGTVLFLYGNDELAESQSKQFKTALSIHQKNTG